AGKEYHPVSPPMPSITRHSAAGEACTALVRSSTYRDPPAHDGSVGSGSLGAPGVAADDQRVETAPSRVCRSARVMAWSRGRSPPGGSGMYPAMSCSEQTTSFRSDSTSGMARLTGTGVTSPTHSDDSRSVSNGTGTGSGSGS